MFTDFFFRYIFAQRLDTRTQIIFEFFRVHHEAHLCKISFNLGQWLRSKSCLKIFF